MPTVAVLGSSLPGEGDPSYEAAREIGRLLARRAATVLCGGYGGVMEAACRGAAEAGGDCVGIILAGRGEPNRWVRRPVVVEDLALRLRRLRDDADAWIFLPHGLGTMLELGWISESVVKGDVPPRPFVLLGSFWRSTVEAVLSEATGPGKEALAGCLRWVETPEEAVALALGATRSPQLGLPGPKS